MRIGIDARFLTHPQLGGFKTYTEELVAALARVDAINDYVLYLDRPPDECTNLPLAFNFAYRVVPASWPLFGTALREQVGVARGAARDSLHVLHEPCLTAPLRLSCPLVLTVHDTIWLGGSHPDTRGSLRSSRRAAMEHYQRWVCRRAATLAALIVTVSKASKERIVERLGVPPERVVVTHEAARPTFRRTREEPTTAGVLRRRGLTQPFVLALGSADPRKNIVTLVDAYARLPEALRSLHELVVVWNHRPVSPRVTARAAWLRVSDRIRFLFEVTDDELVRLYSSTTAFVHPSLEEGFGLTLLEAMACGTPVIAFDNSSIPEITGEAAVLVPTGAVEELALRIGEVLTDERLRGELSAKGTVRARQFSWERCARETIAAYGRAAAGPAASS